MATDPTITAAKRCIVMLVEVEPGKLVLLDSQGTKHPANSPTELWDHAQRMLANPEAPALSSAPGDPTAQAKAHQTVRAEINPEDVSKAWGTIGNRLRKLAEDEYGAPVVGAAATVLGHVGEKASGLARKNSRRGPSGRMSLRRRAGR